MNLKIVNGINIFEHKLRQCVCVPYISLNRLLLFYISFWNAAATTLVKIVIIIMTTIKTSVDCVSESADVSNDEDQDVADEDFDNMEKKKEKPSHQMKHPMPIEILLPYPKMAIYPCTVSLTNLYKSESTRRSVRRFLITLFKDKFDMALLDAKRKGNTSIAREAIDKKNLIENIFIEYGLCLESAEDLKLILATLPDFSNLRKIDFADTNFIRTKWQPQQIKANLISRVGAGQLCSECGVPLVVRPKKLSGNKQQNLVESHLKFNHLGPTSDTTNSSEFISTPMCIEAECEEILEEMQELASTGSDNRLVNGEDDNDNDNYDDDENGFVEEAYNDSVEGEGGEEANDEEVIYICGRDDCEKTNTQLNQNDESSIADID